ncbi:hypothetical protein [Celeribacter sp.]|uniref:hypothetical protein n=1 Tax=Celeribacter sp. TaxID=1890673 RepID=UPI003A91D31F
MTTHETITACKNICRDFSWLGQFTDWVPFFSAVVVVIGGTIAYRGQKKVDRNERQHEEKRLAYAAFLAAYSEYAIDAHASGEGTIGKSEVTKMTLAASLVTMYAPIEVSDLVRELLKQPLGTISGSSGTDGEGKNVGLADVVKAMKADLDG